MEDEEKGPWIELGLESIRQYHAQKAARGHDDSADHEAGAPPQHGRVEAASRTAAAAAAEAATVAESVASRPPTSESVKKSSKGVKVGEGGTEWTMY